MRGRILQYNGANGTGTIVADNQQFPFTIAVWKANTAPVVGKAVDVIAEDSQVTAVMLVPDEVLLREKTAELGGKLNSFVSGLRTPQVAASGAGAGSAPGTAAVVGTVAGPGAASPFASVLERYGKVTLAAYVLFLLGTLAFNAVSISFLGQSQGKPLYDIASLMSQLGAGGSVKFWLLLAYASIALPFVWRDRRAWLALTIPLLAVLGSVWSAVHAIHAATGGFGGGVSQEMSNVFSLGFGFYLALLSALVLAGAGVQRALRAT